MIRWLGKLIQYFNIASKSGSHRQFLCFNAVSDSIFWNLSIILVRMSLPFCKSSQLNKINNFYYYGEGLENSELKERLKIFSTQFASDSSTRQVETDPDFLGDMEEDSGPNAQAKAKKASKVLLDAQIESLEPMNFITQCFNLTHRCLGLCLTGILEKYQASIRFVNRLDYSKINLIKMCNMHLLTTDAILYQNEVAKSIIIFCGHTVNYYSFDNVNNRPPLPNLYIENVVAFLQTCKKRAPSVLELDEKIEYKVSPSNTKLRMASFQGLETTIDIIKGGCQVMLTTELHVHVRSDIANALAVFLPTKQDPDAEPDQEEEFYNKNDLNKFMREKAFLEFSNSPEHLNNLVRAAMQVYNDCEQAGDYYVGEKRRPLYQFFKYFNKNQKCSNVIAEIAKDAKKLYLENSDVLPLFLHFQTKLFQDANQFIDDGLSDLEKLKEMQNRLSQDLMAEPDQKMSDQDKSQLEQEIRNKKSMIRANLSNSKLCLDLILKLTKKSDIGDGLEN